MRSWLIIGLGAGFMALSSPDSLAAQWEDCAECGSGECWLGCDGDGGCGECYEDPEWCWGLEEGCGQNFAQAVDGTINLASSRVVPLAADGHVVTESVELERVEIDGGYLLRRKCDGRVLAARYDRAAIRDVLGKARHISLDFGSATTK